MAVFEWRLERQTGGGGVEEKRLLLQDITTQSYAWIHILNLE